MISLGLPSFLGAACCLLGIAPSGESPPPSDFFGNLRLPSLSNQEDRFLIYESGSLETLLPNLANNRNDFVDLLPIRDQQKISTSIYGDGAIRSVGQITVKQELALPLTYVKTKLEVPDTVDEPPPGAGANWKSDQFLRLALPDFEKVYVFGQLKGSGDFYRTADTDITGKTGVGVKFTPLPDTELQLRTGRQVSASDFSNLSTSNIDRSQFLMEVLAKMPLPLPLLDGATMEYTGSAIGASSTTNNRDVFKQDFRINLPIGKLNEFYIGAKYKSDYSNTTWLDRSEIYMGLTIKY